MRQLSCNGCGRQFRMENGILKEDIFEGKNNGVIFRKKTVRFILFFFARSVMIIWFPDSLFRL